MRAKVFDFAYWRQNSKTNRFISNRLQFANRHHNAKSKPLARLNLLCYKEIVRAKEMQKIIFFSQYLLDTAIEAQN